MAVKLIANYAKRLGLPGFSSHQFSVSVEVELRDMESVAEESARLYQQLQHSVDQQMQERGFVPPMEYGMADGYPTNGTPSNGYHTHGNGQPLLTNGYPARSNGNPPPRYSQNGNTQNTPHYNGRSNGEQWNCTDGQKGLILRVINENKIPKDDVENMAQQMFGIGVRQLDKMQASQLIEDLLERTGKKPRRFQRQPARV
jgi:hypothetical protein